MVMCQSMIFFLYFGAKDFGAISTGLFAWCFKLTQLPATSFESGSLLSCNSSNCLLRYYYSDIYPDTRLHAEFTSSRPDRPRRPLSHVELNFLQGGKHQTMATQSRPKAAGDKIDKAGGFLGPIKDAVSASWKVDMECECHGRSMFL